MTRLFLVRCVKMCVFESWQESFLLDVKKLFLLYYESRVSRKSKAASILTVWEKSEAVSESVPGIVSHPAGDVIRVN